MSAWAISSSANRRRRFRAARRSASSSPRSFRNRATGQTIYILDEPTTGLHFEDVRKLLDVLQRLVDLGNTVIVIEHNLDVIKSADWVIDLGPEGGEGGGKIVAEGTPEAVAKNKKSYTGQALRAVLNGNGNGSRRSVCDWPMIVGQSANCPTHSDLSCQTS